ncbi:MAG: hypothetical protein QOG50_1678 [Actinomycetota bacterium]|jgi:hypothetical protein|nr:hypothetical protein [Actinomycetota bacterium]
MWVPRLPPPAPGDCGAVRAPGGIPPGTRPAHPLDCPQPRQFVDLAQAMGIPAPDAARQVLELIASRAMLTPCGSSTTGG